MYPATKLVSSSPILKIGLKYVCWVFEVWMSTICWQIWERESSAPQGPPQSNMEPKISFRWRVVAQLWLCCKTFLWCKHNFGMYSRELDDLFLAQGTKWMRLVSSNLLHRSKVNLRSCILLFGRYLHLRFITFSFFLILSIPWLWITQVTGDLWLVSEARMYEAFWSCQ